MLHLENVLIYDVPSIVAAAGAITAAKLGKHNKDKIDEVNNAVNGHEDSTTPPLKDQVADIKDKAEKAE